MGVYAGVAFVAAPAMLMRGIGHSISVLLEPASFTFVHTDDREESYTGEIQVSRSHFALQTPSVLGRDLFDNSGSPTTAPPAYSRLSRLRRQASSVTLGARCSRRH